MKEDENNNTANNNPPQGQGGAFLFKGEEEKVQQERLLPSPISVQLANVIAYDRTPSLFDTKAVQERDRGLLEDLLKEDKELNLVRKGKPVALSPTETQIVYALASVLGLYRENEVIQGIIKNPFAEKAITLNVNIKVLSSIIYGTARERETKTIKETLTRLGTTKQVIPIKAKDEYGREWEITKYNPIILTGEETKARLLNPKEALPNEDIEKSFIKIQFGRIFFMDLNTRFALVTPKLFEVWRTGKKGELFSVLLSSVLSAFVRCYIAAAKREEAIRGENENKPKSKRLTETELQEEIEKAQAGVWRYELTYDAIKEKVRKDYTGEAKYEKQYRKKLKDDILKVIRALKEIGLITDETNPYAKREGRKGYKVIFCLNKDYYKENSISLPADEEKKLLPPADEVTGEITQSTEPPNFPF